MPKVYIVIYGSYDRYAIDTMHHDTIEYAVKSEIQGVYDSKCKAIASLPNSAQPIDQWIQQHTNNPLDVEWTGYIPWNNEWSYVIDYYKLAHIKECEVQ
jgi:hypothetical protein